MRHPERKKRKLLSQSKSTLSVPLDLTRDILLRLPVKSIVRFRCVSKLWSSITSESYFISSFETRSSTKPSLLLYFIQDDNLFVSSIPQNTLDSKEAYSSSLLIDPYHMKLPAKYSYFPGMESVHGLICFKDSQNPVVWNLSMRKFLTLPNPNNHKSWKHKTFFLGYDPIEGKHKVVCIRYEKVSYVCRVLTLGSAQESSWRTVKTNHKHRANYYTYGRCIDGVIYYLASIDTSPYSALMSFDVRSEKFDMIEIPSNIDERVLINYKGRIACVYRYNYKERRLWILEDAEKHKWSSQDFRVPFGHRDESSGAIFTLKDFTHAGEFIFQEDFNKKSSYILSCDPVRNSFRRFEFKGVRGGDYYVLRAFPNHIESLLSL